MTERDCEKAQLFLYAYRWGWRLGGKCPEMIALVIRNRVKSGWSGRNGYGYLGVIENAPLVSYTDKEPPLEYPDFRDRTVSRLSQRIDDIVDQRVADEGLASVLDVNTHRLVPALYWIDISDTKNIRPWWTQHFQGRRPLVTASNLWLYS
jgi:hypothetical protein